MTPLRVLHVISSIDPKFGGATTQLVALAAAQTRVGMDVTVVCTFGGTYNAAAVAAFEAHDTRVISIGPTRRPLRRHPDLIPVVSREVARADVVHIHALWEEIQHRAAVAARTRGVPYVFSPHGMLDPWSMARSRWRKKIYMAWRLRRDLNAAAALHFTDDAERQAVAPLGLTARPIVQPIALDFTEFDSLPPAGTFRSRFPALGEAPYVLFLSRLHTKKGLELLLPAFAAADAPGVKLVVAGPTSSDEYLGRLHALVGTLGLTDRVVFTGMLEGDIKRAAYAGARAFALPSHQENFGLVIVEALACGTPVMISHGVAIHRHITAAGVGVALPLDVQTWTAALSEWLTDPARCHAAGGHGAAWVREAYDARQTALAWEGHYRRIIAESVSR